MQIKKLIDIIESFAPPGLALEWDRCGIQVAGTREDIQSMAMALDPDEETIQKAIDLKADFLLTHHPLSIKPRLPDKPDSFYRIIKSLLVTDTILYSAHTSLDANPLGPAAWLASKLKLKNTSVLEPTITRKAARLSFQQPLPLPHESLPCQEFFLHKIMNDVGMLTDIIIPADKVDLLISGLKEKFWPFYYISTSCPEYDLQCGLGFTGVLPSPVSFAQFTERLKNLLGVENIIQAGDSPETVSTVSCCPGSGGDLAIKALNSGARIFITGDLKYHQAQEAARHGCVLDVGHFILEERMMFQWFITLKQKLEDMKIYFIEGRSPFKIL